MFDVLLSSVHEIPAQLVKLQFVVVSGKCFVDRGIRPSGIDIFFLIVSMTTGSWG